MRNVDHQTFQHPGMSFEDSCSYLKDCINNNDGHGEFMFPDIDSNQSQSPIGMVPLLHSFLIQNTT